MAALALASGPAIRHPSRMSMKAALLGAVLGALVLGAGGVAEAQGGGGGGGTRGSGPGGRGSGPRIITLDEIVIEGQVQRPNAFYILNRSSLGYEVLDLRTSFTGEIIRSVTEEPF
jgi:hypothetical protein